MLTWRLRRFLNIHQRRLQSTRQQVVPPPERAPEACRVPLIRSHPAPRGLSAEPGGVIPRGITLERVEEALVSRGPRGRGPRRELPLGSSTDL